MYVMRHIYNLPFGVPFGVESSDVSELGAIVSDFYHRLKRGERSVIAYKGGHIERDLLTELCIPALNLERFGCPKAVVLMKDLIWLETCGNHIVPNAYAHCAKVEVEAFGQWMEKTMNVY